MAYTQFHRGFLAICSFKQFFFKMNDVHLVKTVYNMTQLRVFHCKSLTFKFYERTVRSNSDSKQNT